MLGSGRLVEEVGICVFDEACRRQVVVGDWEAVGVRVVNGGGAGDQGFALPFGKLRVRARGHDGD